jgi:hypothetical protein
LDFVTKVIEFGEELTHFLGLFASFFLESFATTALLASTGSFHPHAFKVEGDMLHRNQ